MVVAPDIVVSRTDPDELTLVVEISIGLADLGEDEKQIKRYMCDLRCPLGMLITLERLYLYRAGDEESGLEAIEQVGMFAIRGVMGVDIDSALTGPQGGKASTYPPKTAVRSAVQRWLEGLAEGADLSRLPPDLCDALEKHVLPALAGGTFRDGLSLLSAQVARELLADVAALLSAAEPRTSRLQGELQHRRAEPLVSNLQARLQELHIDRYRSLTGLTLGRLRRLNLVAGTNNAGKTSVLEAITLLAAQNDPNALLDIVRRRGKTHVLEARWLASAIPDETYVQADMGDGDIHSSADVHITSYQDESEASSSRFYLSSLRGTSHGMGVEQSFALHISERESDWRQERSGTRALCRYIFSSPFTAHDPMVLAELNDLAIESGVKRQVIDFLRTNLDESIASIELTKGAPPRFRVTRTATPPPDGLDLTSYGEGLQRIFHIGLLFAYARGGVVLLDEFENAIHTTLLEPVAALVAELARELDVQVFLTTHSKECVDAFLANDARAGQTSCYLLQREPEGIQVVHYPGDELAELVRLMDADFRLGR